MKILEINKKVKNFDWASCDINDELQNVVQFNIVGVELKYRILCNDNKAGWGSFLYPRTFETLNVNYIKDISISAELPKDSEYLLNEEHKLGLNELFIMINTNQGIVYVVVYCDVPNDPKDMVKIEKIETIEI